MQVFFRHGLSTSVERVATNAGVARPIQNQSTFHGGEHAFWRSRMLPYDRNGLRRADVIPWLPVVVRPDVESLSRNLFVTGDAVAATHNGQYSGCLSTQIQPTGPKPKRHIVFSPTDD